MTTASSTKKLPKAERRAQLLEAAQELVREEGTDALTLARVAERAGVSKPIAYEHFGTRAGLLMALFSSYNDMQFKTRREALASCGKTLRDVAGILGEAHVLCASRTGPEAGAVFSALSGTEEMDEFRQTLRDGYLAEYRDAVSRFVDLPADIGETVLSGLLGAAEAVSRDAAAGRISYDDAVAGLAELFTATLERFKR
ncbi:MULTISPECIES: TetR/AcrR family transcriptional regulator [Hyphomicrobiales]|uniref:TetR/AcrR family transcriptional regulator n=1 Tax=Hyphomicrobiales TaxID=356 RepID=UPI0003769978|nr:MULTISPECIES: TetR/AcrR family transcriptional regulator [Phyllobacteriaceae]MCX8568532.1 TetR/AcrR family transcriptional regulator [Aminobacter sp. MET-1]